MQKQQSQEEIEFEEKLVEMVRESNKPKTEKTTLSDENTETEKKKPGRKKLTEEEKKARRNARDRKRYAENEEYRKKRLTRSKNHWNNLQEDTEKKLKNIKRMQERYYTEIKPKLLEQAQQRYEEKLKQLRDGTYSPPRINTKQK